MRGFIVMCVAALLVVLASGVQLKGSANTLSNSNNKWKAKYKNQPRVRREWRTLSEEMKHKVAKAYWTLKNLTTAEGQEIYGKNFHNHDDMLLLHSCATMDPRCDQGHFGPQFMTFHRALLLKYELALLSVDPSIEAMPYWDMTLDSVNGKYRNDADKYIFTDNYFGDYYGDENQGWAVTNGLFAYWPIAEWSSERFGKDSALAAISECAAKEYFVPPDCSDDNPTKLLRAHQDCTPYVARYPQDPDGPNAAELGGSYEIIFTQADFDACADPANTPVWMAWQNCIEISTVTCNIRASKLLQLDEEQAQEILNKARAMDDTEYSDAASASAGDLMALVMSGQSTSGFRFNCSSPNLQSYYTSPSGVRELVNPLHSQAHIKFGKDLLDVTTSPNEAAAFTGYHANIDRSNFIWMEKTSQTMRDSGYTYPKDQTDTATWGGEPPYGTSGPFSTYDMSVCASDNTTFSEYSTLESPWLPGTLYGDVVNSGFPFFNLFDCDGCDGGTNGYTHEDILYYTSPERTPYTYDTLEYLYYDV